MTVVIALVGLAVVNIPFLTVMGLAAAGTVAIAVLIAITLLPALLGFAGHRVARIEPLARLRPGTRAARARDGQPPLGGFVTRRPDAVLLAGLALLSAVAIPATHMKLGLPDGGSQPTTSTERRSYDLLTEGFGPGFNGTLTVVVDAPELARDEQEQLGKDVAAELQGFPGVAAVSAPVAERGRRPWIVQVTPESGPASDETRDLVTAPARQGRRAAQGRAASRPT